MSFIKYEENEVDRIREGFFALNRSIEAFGPLERAMEKAEKSLRKDKNFSGKVVRWALQVKFFLQGFDHPDMKVGSLIGMAEWAQLGIMVGNVCRTEKTYGKYIRAGEISLMRDALESHESAFQRKFEKSLENISQ